MSRYESYVSHKVIDNLISMGLDAFRTFQDTLDALEKEPYKRTVLVPHSPSSEPGWTNRMTVVRELVLPDATKVSATVYFRVAAKQMIVYDLQLHPVEAAPAIEIPEYEEDES